MLRSLLENARCHGGGSEIKAGVHPLADAGGVARIWVADRGPGVAEQERERIFDRFYRAPCASASNAQGVGLGLALVREIAEHCGGSALCRPRDGGGTVFEVTLRTDGRADGSA
jgi:signal transduction histidine kinase